MKVSKLMASGAMVTLCMSMSMPASATLWCIFGGCDTGGGGATSVPELSAAASSIAGSLVLGLAALSVERKRKRKQ